MSADFICYGFAIEYNKTPNWIDPKDDHILAYATKVRINDLSSGDIKYELQEAVQRIKDAWEGNTNDAAVCNFPDFGVKVLFSGGKSLGNSPTDTWEAMNKIVQAHMDIEMRFKY